MTSRLPSFDETSHLQAPVSKLIVAIEMFDGVVGSRTKTHAQQLRTAMQQLLAAYSCDGPAGVAEKVESLLRSAMYASDWTSHELQNIHTGIQLLPPPGSGE